MIINTDLHIHSKYSFATSKNMTPENIINESTKKGLDLIATGDVLHKKWLEQLENELTPIKKTGIYKLDDNKTKLVATVEVEDNNRIHHLIILPSLDAAWQLRNELTAKNIDADGRPKLQMNASQIIKAARKYNCIIGPAHIFTPWTGLYRKFDTIEECYNTKPDFVELGLSSDSKLADSITHLHEYTFLTNSDAHSPWSYRIAREFNRIKINKLTFDDLKQAIKENDIIENFGYDPRMGKYHLTGCIKCYKEYSLEQAKKQNMKCSCGSQIKKGVKSRIKELSTPNASNKKRPKYTYVVPLAQLISTVHAKGLTTKFVQKEYETLINEYTNEINVLTKTSIEDIKKIDEELANIINSYRNNNLKVKSGRGGKYGEVEYY